MICSGKFSLLVLIGCFITVVKSGLYLPGVSPSTFIPGDHVTLKVNKVTSTKTQLPFDYYDLPFCRNKEDHASTENLGESISGDTTTASPYQLLMKQDETCAILCKKKHEKKDMKLFRNMIDEEYRIHWLVDNLPVAVRNEELGFVTRGFPVGFIATVPSKKDAQHFLFNHVRIIVKYSEIPEEFDGQRIVGFEVIPYSIKHQYDNEGSGDGKIPTTLSTCSQINPASYDPSRFQAVEGNSEEIVYSYDVKWVQTDVKWSHRWDAYLKGNPDDEIHYFSIVNSLMIVLFLTGVVAMIMMRTVHKDIASYNEMQTLEEAQEESGWKLVHGDVFRPPTFSPMLLSVLVGTGIQLLAMTCITMFCALGGLMSPANRGTLLTSLCLLFVFMGSFNGYHSARVYKLFHGKEWKRNTLLAALFYPTVMGVVFCSINFFVWYHGSSTATPFGTMISLVMLWLGVSAPLVFIGSYFGFKKEIIEVPVRTNQIARHIPDHVWYTNPYFSVALGGILPFGAVCIELFFIMSAMWLHQYYFVFGFLFVVLIILVVTCSEITIVMCYFQLCNEDYRWWWRSYLSAGSSGGYLFVYSIWYFVTKLDIKGFVPTVLYFSYMGMISFTFFLVTGSIGFTSCLWFTKKIYGAIKVD